MKLNERIDTFHKKLMKTAIDHKRLSKELPADKCYHDGQSDLSESLAVHFRVTFQEELQKYSEEYAENINT